MAIENYFRLVLCPSNRSPSFATHCLTFWLQHSSGSFCVFPASALEFTTSSRALVSWRIVLETKILRAGGAHCHWDVIASRPSQQTQLENICMYTTHPLPSHTHYIYLSIISTSIYLSIHHLSVIYHLLSLSFNKFMLITLISVQHKRVLFCFSSFPNCSSFSEIRNLALIIYHNLLVYSPISQWEKDLHTTICYLCMILFVSNLIVAKVLFSKITQVLSFPTPFTLVMLFICNTMKSMWLVFYFEFPSLILVSFKYVKHDYDPKSQSHIKRYSEKYPSLLISDTKFPSISHLPPVCNQSL